MSKNSETILRDGTESKDICSSDDHFVSLLWDCTTDQNRNKTIASGASVILEEFDDIGISKDNMVRKCTNIDYLKDKFDSVSLIQRTSKDTICYNKFEGSDASAIDRDGNAVRCRGKCIDVDRIYKQDEDGDTLLHIALIILDQDLALYLIDMTPWFTWLNIQNTLSQTPLHLAVLTNQVSLVRRLVVGGADIESRDRNGNMPIHLACRNNLLNVVRALLEPVRHIEQTRNNYDIPFQNLPANLNSKNYEGLTCLHIAGSLNHIEIVKTLINCGADINVRDEKSGRSILHDAAWCGNLNMVKYLISLGKSCEINSKTYDGFSAFDLARSRGHWSTVIELATAGAKYCEEEMEQ